MSRIIGLDRHEHDVTVPHAAFGDDIRTPGDDGLYAMFFPASGAPTAPASVCQNSGMDYVLHPIEPMAVRLTLVGAF